MATKISEEERELRLTWVEERLVRQDRTRSIVRACVREFEVSIRTAYTYIADVRKQWEQESRQLDREAKRRDIEATLREAISIAFQRKEIVRRADGSPIIRQDDGQPVTVDDPDVRAVIRGASVLADVLGLKTWRLETQVQSQVESLLEAVQPHMTSEAYESLVRALEVVTGVADVAAGPAESDPSPAVH